MQPAATFRSFDGTDEISAHQFRPDRYRQLFEDLSVSPVISRGAGLNYCLASVAEQGRSVLSTQFNRFLEFDPETRIVRLEPGVTMGELLAFATNNHSLPPVIPGHPRITVGGAVAMNVHGKNQFKTGNFADHVTSLTLYHPEKGEIRCSQQENADVFRLTVGGFGLTGHITSVSLPLAPLPGRGVIVERHFVRNILDAVGLMEKLAGEVDYIYSWHNLNLTGSKFGAGVLYTERHCADGPGVSVRSTGRLARNPFSVSFFNRLTIPAMCRAYSLKERLSRRLNKSGFFEAYFPFVGKEAYFRLFGNTGFREYQALFPRDAFGEAQQRIADAIRLSGAAVTFGSLKLMRGERSLLNFSGEGVCLALDTPNNEAAARLFSLLDAITIELGGIANISKDSRLSAATVRAMYREQYDQFRDALRAFDPRSHFQSALQRRLEL